MFRLFIFSVLLEIPFWLYTIGGIPFHISITPLIFLQVIRGKSLFVNDLWLLDTPHWKFLKCHNVVFRTFVYQYYIKILSTYVCRFFFMDYVGHFRNISEGYPWMRNLRTYYLRCLLCRFFLSDPIIVIIPVRQYCLISKLR